MNYQRQHDETDCGPACISMIASHYGLSLSMGKIRELTRTDQKGTNLKGLVHAAERLGFIITPIRGTVEDTSLNGKFYFPFIAHVKVPYDRNILLDHYVVIEGITGSKVRIWDPDPSKKKYALSRPEFLKIWSGYILFMSPGINFKPEKSKQNTLLKFLPLALPHKKNIIIISLASALLILFGIITSYYFKYIADEVIISKAAFTLTAFSIGAILVAVVQAVVEGLRGILINYLAYKTDLQLNFTYITHIFKLPISFFDSRKTGEIISRIGDISKIQEMLSGTALSLVFDCVLIIIISPILFKINGILFGIAVANITLMGIFIYVFAKFYKKGFMKQRIEEAEVNSTLVEAVGGVYTIKALNAEKSTEKIYEKKQMQATWTGWRNSRLIIGARFIAGLINGVTSIIIFWVGSHGIIMDTLTFGTLLSFNSLLSYFTGPLFRIITIQPEIQEASVAADRVSEILEAEAEQQEDMQLLEPDLFEGDIDFSHIAFRYGTRAPVYNDLSFHINKGEWAAFVGPSGCGKTTLVKLILKFYKPDQGTVSIDNRDLQDIDATTLRAHIGYVPQDVYIFAGTIAENIALNNPMAPMDDIVSAAEKAGADEFIDNLPERYNTKLSERGSTLSGGERQRLVLARALLGKPDIIILDEATSNLDSVSERVIHQIIEKLRGSITTIIIAHRLTTVRNCDTIFVMDKGDIVESGSHEELIAKNGLYKTMLEGTVI